MTAVGRLARLSLLLVVLTAATPGGATAAAAPRAATARWVCPPCGIPCDTLAFAGPGTCPVCGMALVAAGSAGARPPAEQKQIAILLFDGVEILDYTGPYEMFGAANCDVYTVAKTRDPVTTAMGMTVVPKHTFTDAPRPDVVVVPGGGVRAAARDTATLAYVREASAQAAITLSVCNGAFIIAEAGLLDGLTATTTAGNIARLASQYPKITVVRDQRYVDNGRIVTAAGLSAGIDGALHVIARLFGTGMAQEVALDEEYPWTPEGGFARAALADQQIPALPLDSLGTWHCLRTEGDTRQWTVIAAGTPSVPDADLIRNVEHGLSGHGWTPTRSGGDGTASRTTDWRFTGSDGKRWTATLKLAGLGATGRERTATLTLSRSGG